MSSSAESSSLKHADVGNDPLFAVRSPDAARAYLLVRVAIAATLCALALGFSLYWQWDEGLVVVAVTALVATDGTVRWIHWRSSSVGWPIFLDITATILAVGLSGLPDVVVVAPLTFLLVSAILTLDRRTGLLAAGYAIACTVTLVTMDSRLVDSGLTVGQVNLAAAVTVLVYLVSITWMTMTAATAVEAHRASEEELHAKRAHLQAVVDTLPMVLFAVDNDGYFTLSEGSALNLIGLSPGEVVGMRVADVYDDEVIRQSISEALASDDPVTMEVDVDGVYFATEYRPMYDAVGKRVGAVGVSMDVTGQVKARIDLENLVQAKDEFVASVSHEIRTPLTVVYGLGEELRDSAGRLPADELQELHHLLATQAGEVAAIVEDLLVAARADTGRLVVVPAEVDVGDEINSVLGVFADERIEFARIPEPVSAWCDKGRFRQIMRNLVTNAVRHGGTRVQITYAAEPEGTIVEVTDDGPGVMIGDESKIFEAYEHSRGDAGTPASIGLGLTVSRHLARLMGGDVTYIRREDLSVFRLTLPTTNPVASDIARTG